MMTQQPMDEPIKSSRVMNATNPACQARLNTPGPLISSADTEVAASTALNFAASCFVGSTFSAGVVLAIGALTFGSAALACGANIAKEIIILATQSRPCLLLITQTSHSNSYILTMINLKAQFRKNHKKADIFQ
jgi:hypothetical protein